MELALVPIVPPEPAGRFRVWLIEKEEGNGAKEVPSLMWDRKLEDSFPELKVLVSGTRPSA
jgi:Rdx family